MIYDEIISIMMIPDESIILEYDIVLINIYSFYKSIITRVNRYVSRCTMSF